MPTYEYFCKNCNEVLEIYQKITDEPLKSCPKCNSEIKKLVSKNAGIIFKGSGYYLTDYKNKSQEKSNS
ncbi:MAG TPA: zinc ribbon domain-containing protein [Ignavibacteriales bacterium]|nr:zinc ribbon domain-containing protein [Ignavibacteriales bacterium]